MPTKEAKDHPNVTENDYKFVKALLENIVVDAEYDWDAVAKTLGLKDAKCTKERWRQIRKRLDWMPKETGQATPRRKRAATKAAAGGDEEPETPSKKGRLAKSKKAVIKQEAAAEEDYEV